MQSMAGEPEHESEPQPIAVEPKQQPQSEPEPQPIAVEPKPESQPQPMSVESQPQSEPEPQPIPIEPEQKPEPEPVPSCVSSTPVGDWAYDPELALEMLMRMVITSDLPFHFVDREVFKEFSRSLQPNYEPISGATVLSHAHKTFLQARKDLIKYFQTFQGKVSLTIHVWDTVYNNYQYICITCHWIDPESWKMSKRIIRLENISYPDYDAEVYDIIMASISLFNIKDKILSITFDDSVATKYAESIEKLKAEINPVSNGVIFNTKCVSHILNSMVKCCLDSVASIILKFEEMHKLLFYLDKRKEFQRFVLGKGERYVVPVWPVPNKWNTTSKWLVKFVRQKPLFVEFYATCDDNDINENDWEIVESLLDILEDFHSSTVALSNAFHPTVPLVLEETLLIANVFKKYKQRPFWGPLVSKMQSKFLKYYETMPPIFSCAAALYPTIGLGGVENILEDIATDLGFGLDDMNTSEYSTVSMTRCSTALREVYDCYEKAYRARARELVPVKSSTSRKIVYRSALRKKSKSLTITDELELYTKTDFSNIMDSEDYESLEVLEWWGDKGRHQYPILAEMARDLLTVQASSVGSEYAFFLNGRVLDESTNPPGPRELEMRTFLKEHIHGIYREKDADFVENVEDESEVDLTELDYCVGSDDEFLH